MAFHRITLTTVGAGISSTLDLQRWNGSAWVSHTTGIAKSLLQLGYVFEDNTGSTSFKIVDNGVCGTEIIFNCDATTTTAPTTTIAPTTTETPTTTLAPTTTEALYFTYYVTDSNTNGCGDEVGSTPYYAAESSPNTITKFYTDTLLSVVYSPGSGTIGWNTVPGPITTAGFGGAIDSGGNITGISTCGD